MHKNKLNLLTTALCVAFIFLVFYGNFLQYQSSRSGQPHIQTIHLDVRLSNFSLNVKTPSIPSLNGQALEDYSKNAENVEDPVPGDGFPIHHSRSLDFEIVENVPLDRERSRISSSDIHRESPQFEILKVENNNHYHLEKHSMIFLVPSTPNSWKFRHYMRTKWLNQSYWRKEELQGIDPQHLDFKLMFIIGRHELKDYSHEFLEELSQNNDMYLLDMLESREILKDKVLFGMKESIQRFDYDFLIKFDHDTMIDLPRLGFGISKLAKKNLFTGSCKFTIRSEKLDRKINYCYGGAYILSRDVVQKIAALNETDTNVTLGREEPEDAYIGYLVDVIRTEMNLSELRPKHKRIIVNEYHSKHDHFWFRTGAGL